MNKKIISLVLILIVAMMVGCNNKPKIIVNSKKISRQMLKAIGKQIDKVGPFTYVKKEEFEGPLTKKEIDIIEDYIGESDKDVDNKIRSIIEAKSSYDAYKKSVDLLGKSHLVLKKITSQLTFLDTNYNDYMKACDIAANIIDMIAKNHLSNYKQIVKGFKIMKIAKKTHDRLKKRGLSSSFLDTAIYLENDINDPQAHKKAEKMYQLARTEYKYTKRKSIDNLIMYGSLIETGKGGPADLIEADKIYKEALKLYEKAGPYDSFAADTYLILGDLYAAGKCVEKNLDKATESWKKARKGYEYYPHKNPQNYRKLAEMHIAGKALNKYGIYDEKYYYNRAADFGDKKSIALLLSKGAGVFKYAIPPGFDKCGSFYNGLARIMQNGKYGYIDKKGEIAISTQYKSAQDFHENAAIVDFNNKEKGLIDQKGNILFKCTYFELAPSISENLLFFRETESSKYGYINSKGKTVIEPQFNKVNVFEEGVAAVMKDGQYGYIDKSGKFTIEPQFEMADSFSEGLAIVKQGGLRGIIDKKGQFILKPSYETITSFHDGHAIFLKKRKKPRNFNIHQFDKITSPKEKELAISKVAKKLNKVGAFGNVGFLNRKGFEVKRAEYAYALDFSEGLAWYRKKSNIGRNNFNYGCLDKDNRDMFTIRNYAEVKPFSEGLAAVKMDSKWGYVNSYGQWQIFPQFDFAGYFHEGLAVVIIDKKAGYIFHPKHKEK